MTANDFALETFLKTRAEAQQSKDIDALMRHYPPDIVYYDVVPPLRFTGTAEVRANFLRWFDGYEGPISLDTHELTVVTEGDTAFANMLHLDSGTRKGGLQSAIWVRETTCLRRTNGQWLITHEHISVPINPINLQAWLPTEMNQPA
ncbi:YybH family protein [Nocardia sp. CDC160]|uniref:YybH family protein n=1 Tax=Nocardia sp. CDC160 TaxID=3112166 RepID=UPI002DB7E5FA|nr:nuclear transport factor 2 family protein [Nocardia sp. CDC160]MEC3915625.1 nuclear transport factor 2 family protein [Nocardia sp. CDC160]